MNLSWQNIFRKITLVVLHPAVEIIIEIIYFITTIYIGIILFKESSQYDGHNLLDMLESYINFNDFNKIKTPTEFKSYLTSTLDKLYTINPSNQEIPIFIPLNAIRLTHFEKESECEDKIDYTKTCKDEINKFKCVIDNLLISFKYKCGEILNEGDELLKKRLKGYYSHYNLRGENNYLDITRETYYSKYQNDVNNIIENKKLKAIIFQINLKSPSNKNYIDIIFGIEMTGYFSNVKKIFSSNIFNEIRPSNTILLNVALAFLIISSILSLLKLIYEMNMKCIYSIHFAALLVKLFDFSFIIFYLIYLNEDKSLDFEINLEEFESHIKYINLIWSLKIFFGIMALFFPVRLMTLLSWVKEITEPFIIIANILFRMMPGLIVSLISIILFVFIFSITNYFLFNDIYPYYESVYQSFISSFNFNIFSIIFNQKIPSRIFNNLFLSKYTIIFFYFQTLTFFMFFSLFIATLVYMFKKAILIEEPEEKNPYLEKLNDIKNKFEENKDKEEIKIELNKLNQKQILWLCLDKETTKIKLNIDDETNKLLFFKNSEQILSFLKYIFTMKPNFQHLKLTYTLNIIIETNKKNLELNEQREINRLTDWLIFIECKIPLIFYGKTHFEVSYKIKLRSLYKYSIFVNNKKELEKILNKNNQTNMTIINNEQFTIGKSN